MAMVVLGVALVAGCSAPATRKHEPPRPVAPAVLPVAGGILRIVASAPVGWTDADGVPTAAAAELSRLSSRQLVSLDGVDSLGDRTDPVPDLTIFPNPSDDKLTLSFRLRSVKYAPPYGGTLQAADVVFGLELLCDPVHHDADADRLADVLVGYAAFCAGMRSLPDGEAGVTAYADQHPIEGLAATAVDTVTMKLLKPQGDLLDILTLPDMTPFPESAFAPSLGVTSWVQAPALGPYVQSVSRSGLTFSRNPAWDPTQDPLRRAWVDQVTLTTASSLAAARASVDAGAADVLLDDTPLPGEQATLPVVPVVGSSAAMLRTTPAGDLVALLPLRSSPGACATALADPAVRKALVIGFDHRPVVEALGGARSANARDWPIPSGFVGGTGAPPVLGQSKGADGPGTVSQPMPALGDTAGLGGDPGQARQLLASVGIRSLACSLSPVDPETGAPDPRLMSLLPSVAAGLRAMGVRIRIVAAGPADLSVERLTSPWRGDGASNLLAPLLAKTTDPVVQAAVLRAEGEVDQNLAATRWSAVANLLLTDGDLVPLAEQRVQNLTSAAVRAFRWYALGDGVDLANAALAGR